MRAEMGMKGRTYADAESFLRNTQVALESNEAANSLMLGLCLRLVRSPEWVKTPPYLMTAEDEKGLVLAAVMTPPQNLVVYGHRGELDEGARILAEDLAGGGWKVPGVLGPRGVARSVVERWVEATGQRCELERRQRVYMLREVKSGVPERGRLRLAPAADLELVAAWRYEFHNEVFGEADREEARRAAEHRIGNGDIYLWEDERPVSMAMKTRPTRNGVSVSLVYTPPELRGRGYATACVGELSRLLLESGWGYCALFADLANVAANRVYQRIGYEPVCDYDEYVFLDEECL
jgi:predicted GNAT family acetyltransferase